MKDQELEKLMRQIANDASLDNAAADDIADSPALWWAVQREIRNTTPAKTPWPPNFLRRFFVIGVPVAAAVLVGLGLYVNSVRTPTSDRAQVTESPSQQTLTRDETIATPLPATIDTAKQVTVGLNPSPRSKAAPAKAIQKVQSVRLPMTTTAKKQESTAKEIKSAFIALAYAGSPESGQLVRVRVPSSMMVQLGVVPTVNDPSKLVDAEVLVGDDGLTHAIRFVRQ